jgi:hypothetical protein
MCYVRRDSELAMLLAQYNNCLALSTMKIFAGYAKMDFYPTCHTEISTWYANRYQKMLESGECTVSYTPNYKLDKQAISRGHHTHPTKQSAAVGIIGASLTSRSRMWTYIQSIATNDDDAGVTLREMNI